MIISERYGHRPVRAQAAAATGGNVVLTLVVQLWAKPGSEHLLIDYEDQVLARLDVYGARVLQRLRAADADADGPFETHVLEFPSQAALDEYMADPERVALSDLRDRAIARTELRPVTVVEKQPRAR
jgi:hypothetical protein